MQIPTHLQSTRDLLANSLLGSFVEAAPPAPQDLIDDLCQNKAAQPAAHPVHVSLFIQVRQLFATPAFALAAVVMLVLVGVTDYPGTSDHSSAFRGANHSASASTTIVLLTEDPAYRTLLAQSGLFDMSTVVETTDPQVAASFPTPKLLVDFTSMKVIGYDSQSSEVFSGDVPSASEALIRIIATAVSQTY